MTSLLLPLALTSPVPMWMIPLVLTLILIYVGYTVYRRVSGVNLLELWLYWIVIALLTVAVWAIYLVWLRHALSAHP